jgi:flagellar basal-body rod protein FlgC
VHARDTGPPEDSTIQRVAAPDDARGREEPLYRPRDVVQVAVEGGGTKAVTVERDPPARTDYAPDDPNAGSDGTVSRPNVDIASEFVGITLAQRAYQAAIKVIRARDQMLGTTIDARS